MAAALSLLRSLQQGSSSSSLTIRVPHLVQRKTTVGEWVSTPVKVWVLVMNTVWRAVVEAIPHFIDVLRQVVDQIFHSKWVTSTIWVLQTIYQNVWEQVPLLSWLGTIIGWLWQWVLKPILTWVAQTIQTLYTWVENVVRWVVERIQDGWDYITHWVAETISKWVEQTDWVQKWVTKEITVWDTEWETVPVPLPAALSAANLKILAKLGITITLGIVSLTQCTPTTNPFPTPDAIATQVACIRTQVAATAFAAVTQTAVAGYTPTPIPTATTLVDTLKTEKELELLSQWLSDHRNDPAIKQWLIEHGLLNSADANNDSKVLEAISKAVVPWQNQYNDDIQRIANEDGIPADYLKALFLHENQLGWTPVLDNPNANGPGQLFGWGLDMAFNSGNAPSTYIKAAYERSGQVFYDADGSPITPDMDIFKNKDGSINYQRFYQALKS